MSCGEENALIIGIISEKGNHANVYTSIHPQINCLSLFLCPGSIYSTLAVGVERYLSVCHPHMTPKKWMAKGSVIILVLFSVMFNVCRFLEFETAYEIEVRNDQAYVRIVPEKRAQLYICTIHGM